MGAYTGSQPGWGDETGSSLLLYTHNLERKIDDDGAFYDALGAKQLEYKKARSLHRLQHSKMYSFKESK